MKLRRFPVVRITSLIARIGSDRRGGTAIEYGLIVGLIVVVLIGALTNLANTTTGMWNNISANVAAAH